MIAALREWAAVEGVAPSSEARLGGRHARGRWAREYPRWPNTTVVSSRFGSGTRRWWRPAYRPSRPRIPTRTSSERFGPTRGGSDGANGLTIGVGGA